MKSVPLCFLLCCLARTAEAAPDPPFEDLLRRAETVFLARVTSQNSDHTTTVEPTDVLRGKCDKPLTLPFDRFEHPDFSLGPGTQFLCLSQGDEKRGLPLPVFGLSFDEKWSWRGWMTLPIKRVDREIYVLGVYSHVDGHWVVDSAPVLQEYEKFALTLSRITQLIERFPYGSVRADH